MPKTVKDEIAEHVNEIWDEFDTDRSGKLNKKETLRFVNTLFQAKGYPIASLSLFD